MPSMQRVRYVGGIASLLTAIFQLACSTASVAAESPLVIRYDGGLDDLARTLVVDNSGNAFVGGEIESADHKREFAVLKYDPAGVLQWTAKYSNALHGTDAGAVRSIAVDAAGNIYAAGMVYTQVSLFTVNMDWLVVSYSPDGVERWSHRINGTANVWDSAGEAVVDAAGNIYVAGMIDDVVSAGGNGWTLIKYSASGTPLWRRTDLRNDGRRDSMGNLHFDATGNLVGTGPNTAVASSAQHDMVTTKVDANGNVLWRRLFSDTAISDEFVSDMDMDASGNIYVTGTTVASTNPELEHVPVTLKYASNGTLLYVLRGDGAGGTSVAVDSFGDIVVSGTSLREGGNIGLIATAKYDAAGNRKWLTAGIEGQVAADNIGNIYAFTSVRAASTDAGNSFDLQTAKLLVDGTLAWQHVFDGRTIGNGSRDDAIAAAVDPFGNFFAVGNAEDHPVRDIVTLRYAANVIPHSPPTSIVAPSALVANPSSGRITLIWSDNSNNEAAFSIERCLGKSCTNFSELTRVGANTTTYINAGLGRSTTYRYRVRAINGSVTSSYTNVVVATTPKK